MKKMKVRNIILIVILIIIVALNAVIVYSTVSEKVDKKTTKQEEKKPDIVEEKEKRMSLVAVGDALIHSGVYYDANIGNGNYDFSHMFTDITPIIENYDLRYYNQETIIGGKNLGISNYPLFNSPDEIGSDLVKAGFNMVSLANNHALDKGETGILHSVEFWKNQGVITSGQNSSFEDRESKIKVYEQNGIKYAFIAYTDTTNGINVPYGKDYLINVYSAEQAKKDIESIKDKVDVIIVSMHWGEEYTHEPNETQKEEAKYLSSLGVNLIIGSHAHVIQPVDYVGDTLVIYSLGNFISAQWTLGLENIIGLMVGMDIVVKDDKVTFENVDYKLLYTYCTTGYRNFKVIPFSNLNDGILNNYKSVEQEYLAIVNRKVN